MIHKMIQKSCDQILPTEQEKQRMLEQILCQKKKRGFQKIWVVGTLLTTTVTALFVMIMGQQAPVQENGISAMKLARFSQIEYKGECYEYVGLYDGNKLKRTKDQIMGGTIYQIKGQKEAIVIYQNGEYQHYQKCRGE